MARVIKGFTSVLYILFLVFPNSLSNSRPWWRPEYEWLLHVFTFNFLIAWFTYLRFTLSIFKLTKQFSKAAGLWTRPVSSRNNIESTVRLTWNQLCQSEEAYISPSFIVIPDKAYTHFTVIINCIKVIYLSSIQGQSQKKHIKRGNLHRLSILWCQLSIK